MLLVVGAVLPVVVDVVFTGVVVTPVVDRVDAAGNTKFEDIVPGSIVCLRGMGAGSGGAFPITGIRRI